MKAIMILMTVMLFAGCTTTPVKNHKPNPQRHSHPF